MHNFKKQFGQNFLKNTKYARMLVQNLELTDKDTVIEIGPGDGAVTRLLLESGAKVISLEIDDDLIPKLLSQFGGFNNFTLVHQSILEANIQELLDNANATATIKVTGSLPYNISKKIIDIFLRFNTTQTKYVVKTCAFIVQEEVAKDYAANSPKSSFLANYSRIFAKVRKLESIPRYMFFPEPKVNGGILRFEIKESIPSNYMDLNKLIRIGFSNPRKTLHNNVKSSGKYSLEKLEQIYKELELKPTVRPAELEYEKWEKLAELLETVD